MYPQQVVKWIYEVFALIAEDMVEDFLVIISYDLYKSYLYASWRPEAVVIEIGKEYALSYVLKSVGEDNKIEQLRGVSKGHDLK